LFIGLIGRNDSIKGHLDFLNAISKVNNCHAVIVGSGITNSKKINKHIDKLNINDKVSLFEQKENIQTLIGSLDLLVSSSYSEGFPTVVAEAMSCEVNVIATNVGDSSFLLGELGLITNPGDHNELSKKIKSFQDMSQIAIEKNGKKLRERIVKKFSSEIMTDRYNSLYISLCSGRTSEPKN
jgi:Glycosyltransferase